MLGQGSALDPSQLSALRLAAGLPAALPPFHPPGTRASASQRTAAAAAAGRTYTCACGQGACGRAHHFHECPVAQAVFATIQQALPPTCAPMQRHHIWLGVCPPGATETVRPIAWPLVSMLAVAAMETGRKRLRQLQMQREAQLAANNGLRQMLITEHLRGPDGSPLQGPPLTPVQRALARAVSEFWACLQAFTAKGLPQRMAKKWRTNGVLDAHPFVGVTAAFALLLNDPRPAGSAAADPSDQQQ